MVPRVEEPLLMLLVKDGDPETDPGLKTTGDKHIDTWETTGNTDKLAELTQIILCMGE